MANPRSFSMYLYLWMDGQTAQTDNTSSMISLAQNLAVQQIEGQLQNRSTTGHKKVNLALNPV